MNTKNNIRFQENEKKIKECFISLINQYDINQITVNQLCKTAGINRSTFYAHFQDIYELLEKLEAEMNRHLYDSYKEKVSTPGFYMSSDYFTCVLTYIKEHQAFYCCCLKKRKEFPISEGKEILFETVVKPYCLAAGITSEMDMMYYFTFFQAGITLVYRRWVEGGCKESVEQMAELLVRCVCKDCDFHFKALHFKAVKY